MSDTVSPPPPPTSPPPTSPPTGASAGQPPLGPGRGSATPTKRAIDNLALSDVYVINTTIRGAMVVDFAASKNLLTLPNTLAGSPLVAHIRDYFANKGWVVHDTVYVSEAWLARKYVVYLEQERKDEIEELSDIQKEFFALVAAAADQDASDIHIRYDGHSSLCDVKFRCHGDLYEQAPLPNTKARTMMEAIFNMCTESDAVYNPLEHQGAQIMVSELKRVSKAGIPPRVNALRLQFDSLTGSGRYLVARLIYTGKGEKQKLEELGYLPPQIQDWTKIRERTAGICLIAGITGSGKSTSLGCILELRHEEIGGSKNILTVEDPVERVMNFASQMSVTNAFTEEERSAAFSGAIKAAMRSDPDIVMIGEIRDRPSAILAFDMAMTGHQVWTTIHAIDAGTITQRLLDLGVEAAKVYNSEYITGLVAQKLVPVLCQQCRISYQDALAQNRLGDFEKEVMERVFSGELSSNVYFPSERACGAKNCRKGRSGRKVVAELLLPNPTYMEILRESPARAREYWRQQMQGISLPESALINIGLGDLCIDDVRLNLGPEVFEMGAEDSCHADYLRNLANLRVVEQRSAQ